MKQVTKNKILNYYSNCEHTFRIFVLMSDIHEKPLLRSKRIRQGKKRPIHYELVSSQESLNLTAVVEQFLGKLTKIELKNIFFPFLSIIC